MAIDADAALGRAASEGDAWDAWRARRLGDREVGEMPPAPEQNELGAFVVEGVASVGATGEALCHLVILKAADSGHAVIAADWLEEERTPAEAWLDRPEVVPGTLDTVAAARVWATASATCGLLAVGRDPGPRSVDLLRGEADLEGRFTGGAYPTFAAAAAYWLAEGPKTEMAEWALRWARESEDELGPWERAAGLTFWGAAGIPLEHPTVDAFLEQLRSESPPEGWPNDLDLTLRVLELTAHFDTS